MSSQVTKNRHYVNTRTDTSLDDRYPFTAPKHACATSMFGAGGHGILAGGTFEPFPILRNKVNVCSHLTSSLALSLKPVYC